MGKPCGPSLREARAVLGYRQIPADRTHEFLRFRGLGKETFELCQQSVFAPIRLYLPKD